MGFLEHYLELTEHTEPPKEFNFWCAMAGLGHVLGRKVWLDQHLFKIFPGQMMVLLCSASALSRKGVAMRLIGRFIETLSPEQFNIIPQRVSSATLLDSMNRQNPENGEPMDAVALIFAEELGTFFSRDQSRVDIPTLVTELNDAKEGIWRAPTRYYGELNLLNPCLGMIAGVTPTGLAHEVPMIVRKTGFLGRTVTVHSEGPNVPCDLIDPPPHFGKLQAWLMADIMRIAELRGPFVWSDDAKEWYRPWYEGHFRQTHTSMRQEVESGWLAREHVHLLRTAMILACAEGNDLVLTAEVLEQALRHLHHVDQGMPQVLREVGVGEDQQRKDRLLAMMDRQAERNGSPWIGTRKLLQKGHRLYDKGGVAKLREDLHFYEQMGRVHRRVNAEGHKEEWRLVKWHGKMLKGVSE